MRKLNITVIVGIVVALIGAGIVFVYGHNVDNKISSGKQTVNVLVADQFLGAGMTAGDVVSHVHVAQIPAAYVVKNAIAETTALSGTQASSAVLSGSVPEGGQLSYNDFVAAGAAGRLAPAKGHVALSIETPISSGVARYLQPGQLVDVFVTYSGGGSSSSQGNSTVSQRTKLFASGVKVLSVSIAQPTNSSNGDNTEVSSPAGSVIVLLDLSPVNAEKVVNAVTLGSVYLAYTTNANDKTPAGATPDSVVRSNR
ncbi:MAG TPA: RcpC/CpaB family pilus assembly protein [Mycobacteriales bacterium]|jgi:Flp pilus assembly protein CpaB|nr:RcpC/CpaB family pilus assembly protein [Mycobacteriales bacterium]